MALLELNIKPSTAQLRSFGLLWWPAFCVVVGAVLYSRVGANAAYGMWGAGILVSVLGLLYLPLLRAVFVALICLTFPIGLVVANVLVLFIFYFVITPVALIARGLGHDAMGMRGDKDSYWLVKDQPSSLKRYFRQF